MVGIAAVLLGATACNSTTLGQPAASTTSNGGGSTSPPQTTGSTAPTGGSLPVDNACSLLSASDLQQIGVSSQPTRDTIGVAPSCEMDTAADHIVVSIFPNDGVSTLNVTGPIKSIKVGSHAARREVDNTGSCLIAIDITSSSSVDVTSTGNGNNDPCPGATTVAQLVEPKLP